MKKILVLILVFAMVLSLAACTQPETPAGPGEGDGNGDGNGEGKEGFKIGVVIPSGDHGFTGESVAHAKMEAEALMEKYDDLEISVRDGLEASDQITSIENLISGGDIDLIMLWPMEGEALRSAAQSILDAGIELVIYDRLIENFDGLVGEIMGDNYGIATLMGEYINEYYEDETNVKYLRFVGDSSTVTSQRSDGMDAVIDDKFEQVANTFVTNWSTETAQEQMENWLNSKSVAEVEELGLIVTHDDEIVDGLMNAIEAYSGDADINIKLITSVGGREDTLAKFETTDTDVKFATFYFAPAFIRESLRLSVTHLYDEPYDGAVLKDGQYLIPSFSISNAGNADHDFDSYRASDIYEERYSIGNF